MSAGRSPCSGSPPSPTRARTGPRWTPPAATSRRPTWSCRAWAVTGCRCRRTCGRWTRAAPRCAARSRCSPPTARRGSSSCPRTCPASTTPCSPSSAPPPPRSFAPSPPRRSAPPSRPATPRRTRCRRPQPSSRSSSWTTPGRRTASTPRSPSGVLQHLLRVLPHGQRPARRGPAGFLPRGPDRLLRAVRLHLRLMMTAQGYPSGRHRVRRGSTGTSTWSPPATPRLARGVVRPRARLGAVRPTPPRPRTA